MSEQTFRQLFGRKIYLLRKQAEMTQMDLASALGYTSSGTISQIEAGRRGMDNEKIKEVARLFGVNPFVLLSEQDMDDDDLQAFLNLSKVIMDKKSPHREAIITLLNAAVDKHS